jgi:hypothetical protein
MHVQAAFTYSFYDQAVVESPEEAVSLDIELLLAPLLHCLLLDPDTRKT